MGGEILPYLKRREDLLDFMLKYRPRFVVVSSGFGSPHSAHTILGQLKAKNPGVGIGSSVDIKGLVFHKIADHPVIANPLDTQWESLFEVTYPGMDREYRR